MKLFTDDPKMIALVGKLLAVDIVLEIGRVTNLVYGNALKTSGDAVFPVVIGAVFMFLCAVGGTYLFGIKLGLLAVGAYIGLASDECVRAIGMCLRWHGGKWKEKRYSVLKAGIHLCLEEEERRQKCLRNTEYYLKWFRELHLQQLFRPMQEFR